MSKYAEDRPLRLMFAWAEGHLTDAEYERELLIELGVTAVNKGQCIDPWLRSLLLYMLRGGKTRRNAKGWMVAV